MFTLCCAMHAAPEKKQPVASYRQSTNPEFVRRFEQKPSGWTAGFGSDKDWRGQRGFSESSRASKETGIGWFSDGKNRLYREIRAPRDAPHAICEGQFSADHTQLTAVDAHSRVKAGQQLDEVAGSFDMTVAFMDDGTPRTRNVFNSFFQIFEHSKERGWRPAYGLFYHGGKLKVGAWDDNPAVPGVTLERGRWYRIRFDVTLRHDGARTVLSVWPVASDGRQEKALISALVIDHQKGLRLPGLARSFPVMAGSYTWGISSREKNSAATLISAFSQNAAPPASQK